MSQKRTLNQGFFKEWSQDMAYVLGFFAADGSMLLNRRGSCFIEFTSTDRILLEHVQRATGSDHVIALRPSRNATWKDQYRLQIGSKEWFGDLTTLGFTQGKSGTLAFPDVPDPYLGAFVRGYFDGDGCVYFNELAFAGRKKKRWILMTLFTSGSRPFLEELARRVQSSGVRGGSFLTKARGTDLRFSHADSLALCRLLYHTAPTSGLFLSRKREKLERAINVLALDKKCGRSSTG